MSTTPQSQPIATVAAMPQKTAARAQRAVSASATARPTGDLSRIRPAWQSFGALKATSFDVHQLLQPTARAKSLPLFRTMGREDHKLAATLLLGSSFLFASAGAAVKFVSAQATNEMVVFSRSFVGLVVLMPWLVRGGFAALRTPYPRRQVTRAFAGLGAMYCFFYAIARLPLGEAMLLNYSSPVFIPFIAWLWIGEPIPPRIGWAIGSGLAGITLILKPGLGFLSPASIIGLTSGLLTATAMVAIRGLAREARSRPCGSSSTSVRSARLRRRRRFSGAGEPRRSPRSRCSCSSAYSRPPASSFSRGHTPWRRPRASAPSRTAPSCSLPCSDGSSGESFPTHSRWPGHYSSAWRVISRSVRWDRARRSFLRRPSPRRGCEDGNGSRPLRRVGGLAWDRSGRSFREGLLALVAN
jgi:hypothetical protein